MQCVMNQTEQVVINDISDLYVWCTVNEASFDSLVLPDLAIKEEIKTPDKNKPIINLNPIMLSQK